MAAHLERRRTYTLETLARHFAEGDLRFATMERRVEQALAAHTEHELLDTTWDLPPQASRLLSMLQGPGAATHRPCSRIMFQVAWKAVLRLDAAPGTWTLGRSRSCDIVLPQPGISRRHAEVSVRGGRCTIRDLASTNGLTVNGLPASVAVLHPGDNVTLGTVVDAVVR